jgi:peptidoglycan hydrolase-like protein with peptidoglycan-binding domain
MAETPTIKDVQLFLNRTDAAKLVADGEKGPATTAAVVAWQTSHGIDPATGNLDPITLAKMFPVMEREASKPLTIQATIQDWVLNWAQSRIVWAAGALVALTLGWINTRFGITLPPDVEKLVTGLLVTAGGALIAFLRGMAKDTERVASKMPAVIQKPAEYVGQKP